MRAWMLAMVVLAAAGAPCGAGGGDGADGLRIGWEDKYLTVHGEHIPGSPIRIHYLEAYCRAGSTDADWVGHTLVGHETVLVAADDAGTRIELRCTLGDGLVVDHVITAGGDEVDFRLIAHNPTGRRSDAHWAQPCIRVGDFTGFGPEDTPDEYAYLARSFVFIGGELERMPTRGWATEARYTPGQVWAAPGVPADDVNPRPVNAHRPSRGLIGCFSGDESLILATAWEPYQELFQGVARCLHSDFRLGGIGPGETKRVRGKLYIVPADVEALVERYEADFPEHAGEKATDERK